ncbi:MAG: hypothetical protein QF591_00925 [Candidatus Thalassarchaeum sp.]|nr:hypothetical protein [Candidatus Thalassarchaeum sp.]
MTAKVSSVQQTPQVEFDAGIASVCPGASGHVEGVPEPGRLHHAMPPSTDCEWAA